MRAIRRPSPDTDTTAQRRAKRYLRTIALSIFCPIAVVALTNFVVDPFQFFRSTQHAQFSTLMMRHQLPGVVRHYPFDAIVVGNSYAANMRPEWFANYQPKIELQNLALYGGTLNESAEAVRLALRLKPIKVVFWQLGHLPIRQDFRRPDFPQCLYSSVFDKFPWCYLLSIDVFRETLPTVLNFGVRSRDGWTAGVHEWQTYPDRKPDIHQHACALKRQYGSVSKIEAATKNAEQRLRPVRSTEAAKFERAVFPIVDGHPDIKFVFFTPPFYHTEWWWFAQTVDLSTLLFLEQELLKRKNVEVFDFQTHLSLTQQAEFFGDLSHGNSGAVARMGLALSSGQFRVIDLNADIAVLRKGLSDAEQEVLRYLSEENCG